jgi:acetyl-CoA carboxylase biotin carboxyl carrier protein
MIDIRKLKELVRLMVENDLSELDLKDQEETVLIKRHAQGADPVVTHRALANVPVEPAQADAPTAAPAAEDDSLLSIESPMVGTYYAAANPDSDPFIKVGDEVTPDTVVCLVEAMKVYNELKAECAGTVAKILVTNGQSVEFGQKLMLVRPS